MPELALPEPESEPDEPAELAEPVLSVVLGCADGVLELPIPELLVPELFMPAEVPAVPLPYVLPVVPAAPVVLPVVALSVVPVLVPGMALDDVPVVLLVLPVVVLWVVVSVCGEFLFFFMSPSANAEPLASATIEVKMNAGASLRIWASLR